MNFSDIQNANASIRTTNIKGKEYAEVNQRIKAFRMVYPDGYIKTDILCDEDGKCVITAECGCYENGEARLLGTGTAYEKESSSYINKTSYIENCETSAVGRALGMAGFGIDTSVASYEEVANAIHQQEAEKAQDDPIICPDCGRPIADRKKRNGEIWAAADIAAYTRRLFGVSVCADCGKLREAKNES